MGWFKRTPDSPPRKVMPPRPEEFYPTATDGDLARAFVAGDERAFETLLNRHRGLIVSTAFAIMGDAEDAQDVAQEALATAFQRMGELQEPDRVRNWLVRITRNAAIDAARRRRGPRVVSFEELRSEFDDTSRVDMIPDEGMNPREHAESAQLLSILFSTIESMPPQYREPLVLRVVNGLSYQEISDQLGVTLATTKVRIFRARDQLMVKLRERNVRLKLRGFNDSEDDDGGQRRVSGSKGN